MSRERAIAFSIQQELRRCKIIYEASVSEFTTIDIGIDCQIPILDANSMAIAQANTALYMIKQ